MTWRPFTTKSGGYKTLEDAINFAKVKPIVFKPKLMPFIFKTRLKFLKEKKLNGPGEG